MTTGVRMIDKIVIVRAFAPAVPSSAAPLVIRLRYFDHVSIKISYANATTVTGSAITMNQGTGGAGTTTLTATTPLGFSTLWAAVNQSDSHALTQTAVVSNTFTTDATNSQSGYYFIEISALDLNVANGFNCIQVGIGNATAATISAEYILGPSPRYAGGYDSFGNPQV
jgi:hypothetical protein